MARKKLKRRKDFPVLVLAKATNYCNMNCVYCYNLSEFKKYKNVYMGYDTVKDIARLMRSAHQLNGNHLVWHGGEMTTIPEDVLQKYFEIIHTESPNTSQAMQSNGLELMNKGATLYNNGIGVGISYDGQCQTLRPDQPEVKANIVNYMNKFNMHKSIGTIAVITKENIDDMISIYEEAKRGGYVVALNCVFITEDTLKQNLFIDGMTEKLEKYFVYALRDTLAIEERLVSKIFSLTTDCENVTCYHIDCRLSWFGVNPDGTMLPCDRPYDAKFNLGTTSDWDSLDEYFESEPYADFYYAIEENIVDKCKNNCKLYHRCRCGCYANHMNAENHFDTVYCKTIKTEYLAMHNALVTVELEVDKTRFNSKIVEYAVASDTYLMSEIESCLEELGVNFKFSRYTDWETFVNSTDFELLDLINPRDYTLSDDTLGHPVIGRSRKRIRGTVVSVQELKANRAKEIKNWLINSVKGNNILNRLKTAVGGDLNDGI